MGIKQRNNPHPCRVYPTSWTGLTHLQPARFAGAGLFVPSCKPIASGLFSTSRFGLGFHRTSPLFGIPKRFRRTFKCC